MGGRKIMKKIIGIFIMTLLIGTLGSHVSACTGFTYSDENTVFIGMNLDRHDHNFNIRSWVTKPVD